jgi:hypothetical protein
MKALTIWQPWASLIVAGAKPWEWRGYPAPRALIGQRIAIHAGARPVRTDEIAEIWEQLEAGDSSLLADKAAHILRRATTAFWRGCIVGTAQLGIPITADDWARQHAAPGYDSDRIDHHKWAWPLGAIEVFEPPIPARGAQGFWEWQEPAR